MSCIKEVGNIKCQYCKKETIKYGMRGSSQRYRCKECNKIQLAVYKKRAYEASVNSEIAAHVKEGCGIRSIARLLHIAAGTVLCRIQKIADSIKKPAIATKRAYEVDELKTYVKSKANEYWVIYAIDKDSKVVVDLKVANAIRKTSPGLPKPCCWQHVHTFIPTSWTFTGLLFQKKYTVQAGTASTTSNVKT